MNQRTADILAAIRRLPQLTLETDMRSPRGTFRRSFTGALLYDYLQSAGLVPDPPRPLGFGGFYYVAEAEDGARVTLTFAEASPRFTPKQVMLAYEQDGETIRNGVRLVVPGDDLAGRSIGGLVSIELRSAGSNLDSAREPASSLVLGGLVEQSMILDAPALGRFETREVETLPTPRQGGAMSPAKRYRGVALWEVLQDAGIVQDPAINEDILRRVVVCRSTDGYAAVVAAGELDPRFMNGDVIIATHVDGAPLPAEEGAFRLVVPYDHSIGRAVKSLAAVEVVNG